MKITGKGWFSIVLLIISLFFFIDSFYYVPKAKIIPIGISVMTLVFTLIQIGRDVFSLGKADKAGAELEPSPQDPNASQTQDSEKSKWLFVLISVIWLAGFTALLSYSSYLIAVPVFLFFYVWLVGKIKVMNALLTAAGMGVFMYLMFSVLLGV